MGHIGRRADGEGKEPDVLELLLGLDPADRAMRQILIDRARRNSVIKRGGDRRRLPLDVVEAVGGTEVLDVLEVADMLQRLRSTAPREAHVVELRFFGGLSNADIATLLGVSERTVRNDWSSARRRLHEWTAG